MKPSPRPSLPALAAASIVSAALAAGAPLAQVRGPQSIVVVVSAANPATSLELAHVRRLFLRVQTVWPNGTPVAVFERSSENAIRTEFSSTVLGKRQVEMAEYWLNVSLTRGLEPPKVCRTPSLLKQYLDRTKGGIGYVYESELLDGMKIVARITPKDQP